MVVAFPKAEATTVSRNVRPSRFNTFATQYPNAALAVICTPAPTMHVASASAGCARTTAAVDVNRSAGNMTLNAALETPFAVAALDDAGTPTRPSAHTLTSLAHAAATVDAAGGSAKSAALVLPILLLVVILVLMLLPLPLLLLLLFLLIVTAVEVQYCD